MSHDLSVVASEYRDALPDRIRAYLNGRGIPDELIELHQLGWNGRRITIPIFDRDHQLVSFKLAKDPQDRSNSPKMLSSRGATVQLYGWERVLAKPCRLIVCEGEFDRLVLEAYGFAAVTSTGGAGSFRREWASDFSTIPEVLLCFDRDEAGRHGALRAGQILSHAKIIELPDEVGPGGDVSDFFLRLGRTREQFLALLEAATPVPVVPPALPVTTMAPEWSRPFGELSQRIADVKRAVPIEDLVGRYVPLRKSGTAQRGLCPFHEDHHPSLMVYPETGSFRCYGCNRHGDVITFAMLIEKLPFVRALDHLENLQNGYAESEREAA